MSCERFADDYVCKAPCSGCPFRLNGSQVVRLTATTAKRVVDDLTNDRMFPCHQTTHPEGLSDSLPIADRADWRFCAGAYLSMSPQQRLEHQALRTVTALGYHNPDTLPAGEKLVFNSLDEFIHYYGY